MEQAINIAKDMNFDMFMSIMEWIGTIAFAVSGAVVAIRHDLDYYGIIFLAIIKRKVEVGLLQALSSRFHMYLRSCSAEKKSYLKTCARRNL